MSPSTGTFESDRVSLLSSKPARANDCPSRSSTPVFARRVRRAGINKAVEPDAVREIDRRNFGLEFEPDVIFIDDRRLEVQTHAIFFEHDGDCASLAAALDDRNGKLAAREEARLLAIHGDQIWLGQRAQRALRLQCANICARRLRY